MSTTPTTNHQATLTAERQVVRLYLDKVTQSPVLSATQESLVLEEIRDLLSSKRAKIVAHYYTDSALQDLAEASNGFVGDSLEMARFGRDCDADILAVAGVRFMGETAKILSPDKTVLMPTLEATCSLDIACPIGEFSKFCDEHPERKVVVYANTSAEVKARADWVVTSSIALEVAEHLSQAGEKIIWAPDKHLGAYIQKSTGADVLLWDAACIVHEEFKARGLLDIKAIYPDAAILAHPESPSAVLNMADVVGSTTQIINAAKTMPNRRFIVATDQGIFHKLRQVAPDKEFIVAPTAGNDATCRSCAACPWMGMNSLTTLRDSLRGGTNVIEIDAELITQAMIPLQRMLDFAVANQLQVKGKA